MHSDKCIVSNYITGMLRISKNDNLLLSSLEPSFFINISFLYELDEDFIIYFLVLVISSRRTLYTGNNPINMEIMRTI